MNETWEWISVVVAIIIVWQLLNWNDRRKAKNAQEKIDSEAESGNDAGYQFTIRYPEPPCEDEDFQQFLDSYSYLEIDSWYKQIGCMKDYTEKQKKAVHNKIREQSMMDFEKRSDYLGENDEKNNS